MNLKKSNLKLFILFFFLVILQAEEKIKVKAEISKNEVLIGDEIKYTLKVITKKNIDVKFPEFGENLGNFAIKDFGSSKKQLFGKKILNQWYLLETYTTGKYTIPSTLIKYKEKSAKNWQKIKLKELKIEVKSMLKSDSKSKDIKNIKGPINFSNRILFFGIFVVSIITITGILILIILRKRKRELKKAVILKTAYEIACKQLEELKQKVLVDYDEFKEYYISLSDIVRHYIENSFDLKAPEMTTEEFLIKVKKEDILSSSHKNLLKNFLLHCDLVKFAKYGPSSEEANLSFISAKKFIDETKSEKLIQIN